MFSVFETKRKRVRGIWRQQMFLGMCGFGMAAVLWNTALVWGQEEGKKSMEAEKLSSPNQAQVVELKAAERSGLELTVYQQGFSLVKDIRQVALRSGENTLTWDDVPAQVDLSSLRFQSLNDSQGFSVASQDFLPANVSPAQLLPDFVGHEITLVQYDKEGKLVETLKGTLLNASREGGLVASFQVGDQIYLYPEGKVVLPMPGYELRIKPRLLVQVASRSERMHNLLLSYQTEGINWQGEHSVILSADESTIALESAVIIRNQSGVTYPDANLKLLAGDVGSRYLPMGRGMMFLSESETSSGSPTFGEAPLFEYHTYDLDQKGSLYDQQSKRLTLFSASNIKAEKRFVFESTAYNLYGERQQERGKVRVDIKFPNDEAHGLGKPLPAGRVRIYKQDKKASLQFIGQDNIAHTGRGQEVKITTGNAFDLSAEQKVSERRPVGNDVIDENVEVELTNGKEEEVVIWVVQRFGNFWEILKSSHDYIRQNANTVEFKIPVPQTGKVKLAYTVRLKNR